MVSIYAIGPGGGGGSGAHAQATNSGGGGGGSGGISRLTIPIFMLPDSLYIQVSPGGSGGTPAVSSVGTAGNVAFTPVATKVSMAPSTTSQYLYLEANAGDGGGGGGNGVNGTAGAAAAIATVRPFALLGATFFIAGNAGAVGGSSITQGTASQIYGGAGGGADTGINGGVINALANTPFTAVRASSSSAGVTAANGFSWSTIFPGKIYGGAGGGGSTGSAAMGGGAGCAWGAGGGGGGGGGVSSPSSGAGGDGGPGCVIITCW
jgi:hypothetical protein